jgi:hypothetical protein
MYGDDLDLNFDSGQCTEIAQCVLDSLLTIYPEDAHLQWMDRFKYTKYQDDPVRFGQEILGEWYTEDVKIMMESVRDYTETVAISCTGAGKTFSAASIAIWFYKCFPEAKVYTLAAPPEDNLKNLLWGELNKKTTKSPHIFEGDIANVMHIKRMDAPWSFITGLTIPQSGTEEDRKSKFSGKHANFMLFIVDEGDAVPDEVYSGIDGCMSGGHVRMLIMFNPKKQSGAVYRKIRDERANVVHLSAFSHPNVITGREVIPGAVDQQVTVKRINEETSPLVPGEEPDSNCFEVPPFLVGTTAYNNKKKLYPPLRPGWRKIKTTEFHYKVLGRYPPRGSNQLIDRDKINEARTRWDLYVAANGENPPIGVRPIYGLDIADMGDDKSCLCRRFGGWVPHLETWQGVSPDISADKVAPMAKAERTTVVNVDANGVGISVPSLLRKQGVKASRVMVTEKPTKEIKDDNHKARFNRLNDQLTWEVKLWIEEDNTSMIPPDDELIEELEVITYEEKFGRIVVLDSDSMKKALGRSPDKFKSLMMTFAPKLAGPRVRTLG